MKMGYAVNVVQLKAVTRSCTNADSLRDAGSEPAADHARPGMPSLLFNNLYEYFRPLLRDAEEAASEGIKETKLCFLDNVRWEILVTKLCRKSSELRCLACTFRPASNIHLAFLNL
jgi:hypothetical protein